MEEKFKIYRPRNSMGGLFNGSILLIFILLAIVIFWPVISNFSEGMGIIILILTGPIWAAFIIISFIFFVWYPTMRYELSKEKLVLKCGPFKSEIILSSIKEIRKKDLKYHPSSTGWKLPGYCLFRVKYTDEDWVRMYSRAILKNVIIIETDKEKYGITPANEESFLKDIMEKVERK